MTETNVLFVLSDEHRPDALGCAGHPMVETPTLDGLAAGGVRFTDAYCSSPLCVPSRASLATGRYVHEIGFWDNATPYDGTPESWGHHLTDRGVDVTTIGELDFVPDVDDGFADQRLPNHRASPDVHGLHRDPPIDRETARERILDAGPIEEDDWTRDIDERRTQAAVDFLEETADADDPWVLQLGYGEPHFPLRAGREYYDRYPPSDVDLPYDYPAADDHPILEELREHFDGRDVDEETLRRTRAAYYGLCTALDDHVERVLDALVRTGQDEDTLVIYASDHGEPLGDHELWWKCCMYEQSVGVPLIVNGPGIAAGETVREPVSLLDVVPTIADAVGVDPAPEWQGRSLLPTATGEIDPDPDRAVFSEYHAHGTSHGMFMLRQGRFKYVYYPDNPDQLFDLEADPKELENLAAEPEYADVCDRLAARLREIADPDAVDQRALREQRGRLAELEGD